MDGSVTRNAELAAGFGMVNSKDRSAGVAVLEAAEENDGNSLPEAYLELLHAEIGRRWLTGDRLLDGMCRHALAPGGKMLRPVLLLESAAAVGGRIETVLPAAVGTECGHVASLVHDDIIDGDEMRRGRPAVHSRFGVGQAIVAGDALIFYLFQCLAECRRTGVPEERIVWALDVVARAGYDLCQGQSLESELAGDLGCDVDTYLTMIRLKTSALFRASCETGAILGLGTAEQAQVLAAFGDHLGTAFQIHDDLLAYTSDPATTGKQAVSDVRNKRLTLPVILAYQTGGPADRSGIEDIMAGRMALDRAYALMDEIVRRTGAVAASRRLAREHAAAAQDRLAALPPTPSRARLARLAELAVNRDR